MQKVCVQIYRKGKRAQPLKNSQINQNEQTQIDVTDRFYCQNMQALTRAKNKSTKAGTTQKAKANTQKYPQVPWDSTRRHQQH